FLRAERKLKLNVHAGAGVVRKFFWRLPILRKRSARQTDVFVKTDAFHDPVLMPDLPAPIGLRRAGIEPGRWRCDGAVNGFDGFIGLDEKLQFHLLEFAG